MQEVSKKHKTSNLYGFIRLLLGDDIADSRIAKHWGMDVKNFHEFKTSKYPIPRLERLVKLGRVLRINPHLVFEVASGTPAQYVYNIIKNKKLIGKIKLLPAQLDQISREITESEKRYQEMFNNANDAIFIADAETAEIIECNIKAEKLLGRTRKEIVGMNRSEFHPSWKRQYYKNHFRGHVRKGEVIDSKPSEIMRKNGTIIPVLISAKVFKLDGRKVIQGIFRGTKRVGRR